MNYKEIEITDEGILVNKEYYKYIKNYEIPEIISEKLEKKIISKSEYNFLLANDERKVLENCKEETRLIKWNAIQTWSTSRDIKGVSVSLKIKNFNKELEPSFKDDYALITALEKYCFNKGQVDEKANFIGANLIKYGLYILVLLACFYMLSEMFK